MEKNLTTTLKSAPSWLKDVSAICCYISLVIVFFYPVVFQAKLPIPSDAMVGRYHPWKDALSDTYPQGVPYKNFLISDPFRQQIPWKKLVIDQQKSGHVGWNPYSMGGMPLDTNIQAAPDYLINYLFHMFSFEYGWTVLIIGQMVGYGIGVYAFLRSEENDRLSALLGSIIISFSSFSIVWLYWGTIVSALLWLPYCLLLINHIYKSNNRIKNATYTTVLSCAYVLTITAGHHQIAAYVIGVSILFGVYKGLMQKQYSKAIYPIIAFLTVVIASREQIARYVDFFGDSVRAIQATDWKTEGFFIPINHLIQYIAPDFFGNPSTLNYFGDWNYGELVGYISIPGLVLAVTGLSALKKKREYFWLGILFIGIMYAVDSVISHLPFVFQIPIVSSLQPTRFLAIITFGLTYAAAHGLMHLESNVAAAKKITVFVLKVLLLAIVIAILGIGYKDRNLQIISLRNSILPLGLISLTLVTLHTKKYAGTSLQKFLLICLICADLFRFGWKFLPFTERRLFFPESQITNRLQGIDKPFRTMSTDIETAPTNTLTWYNIEEIGGYDPIYSIRYANFFEILQNNTVPATAPTFSRLFDPNNINSPILRYADVKYIISNQELPDEKFIYLLNEGTTYLYEVVDHLGRWYIADRIIFEEDSRKTLENMITDSHQGKPAFVESAPFTYNNDATVTPISYTDNEQVIQITSLGTTYLVNATAWNKNWHAYIGLEPAKIYHTNYLFMGIHVPSGSHQVTFRYQ